MKTDLSEAEDILAKRVAELDAKFNGHDSYPSAYVPMLNGGRAIYVFYTANGIKEQGRSYGPLAPTAIDAAKGWVATTHKYLDGSAGTLFWRKRPRLELKPAVSFEETTIDGGEGWAPEMSPAGWTVASRLIIANGEPGFNLEEMARLPEDFPDEDRALMAAARERYFAAKKRDLVHG